MLNANIGAIAAGTVTSVLYLRNGLWTVGRFRSMDTYLWRPGNATGVADYVRTAGSLAPSTGVLDTDSNWSDTTLGTENIYLIYYGIHPQNIVNAMNRAARKNSFENEEPLSLAADAGFQSTATSSYAESDADGGAATTFTKITTADSFNVFPSFIGSGRVLNAAANGYIRQRFNITRSSGGEEIYVGWLNRADVGTSGNGASLVLYDITNSALLGTAISSSEENWQYMWRRERATGGSAGTEILEVRLQGIGANDDLYMNGLWVYRTSNLMMPLSTTWDSSWKVPALSYLSFGKNIASHVEDAWSVHKQEIPKSDYKFLISRPGANPYALQWQDTPTNPGGTHWYNYPILIQGRRAYSDIDTAVTLALTQSSSQDLDLWESAVRMELFSDPEVNCPDKAAKLAKATDDWRQYSAQQPVEGPAQTRRFASWPVLN